MVVKATCSCARKGLAAGSTVAIKHVDLTKYNKEQTTVLMREVEFLRELRHESIVKLYDFFISPDKAFLVLEFVAGGELYAILEEKKAFSERAARDILLQLMVGFATCLLSGFLQQLFFPFRKHCHISKRNAWYTAT